MLKLEKFSNTKIKNDIYGASSICPLFEDLTGFKIFAATSKSSGTSEITDIVMHL